MHIEPALTSTIGASSDLTGEGCVDLGSLKRLVDGAQQAERVGVCTDTINMDLKHENISKWPEAQTGCLAHSIFDDQGDDVGAELDDRTEGRWLFIVASYSRAVALGLDIVLRAEGSLLVAKCSICSQRLVEENLAGIARVQDGSQSLHLLVIRLVSGRRVAAAVVVRHVGDWSDELESVRV